MKTYRAKPTPVAKRKFKISVSEDSWANYKFSRTSCQMSADLYCKTAADLMLKTYGNHI